MRERLRTIQGGLRYQFQETRDAFQREMFYRTPGELSPTNLLHVIDPHLESALSPTGLEMIRQAIGDIDLAVDYGAARNPLRALVFGNARRIVAVDPAYKYYNHEDFQMNPDPELYGVFGGKAEWEEMKKLMQWSMKKIKYPDMSSHQASYTIAGMRSGTQRKIELIPQKGESWLQDIHDKAQLAVVWRAFPTAETWGHIIERLPIDGVLITTGYGSTVSSFHPQDAPDYDRLTCGIDVDNTALPRNGNFDAIGMVPLVDPYQLFAEEETQQNMYFYRKRGSLTAVDISEALRQNI